MLFSYLKHKNIASIVALAAAFVGLNWTPAYASDEGAMVHVRSFDDIAKANEGHRAAGSAGYDASAEYVARTLQAAGYEVRMEEFSFPFFEERSPPTLSLVAPNNGPSIALGDIQTLRRSGTGQVVGGLSPVDLDLNEGTTPTASTSGCEPEDFRGFGAGRVALLRRGTCTFQVKVDNAVAAGAAAVVVMNEGTPGRLDRFSGVLPTAAAIPVVAISFEQGRALASRTGAQVSVKVDAAVGTRTTRNVLADTRIGHPDEVVVVGAHLDSVREGPGMNDNASGSAAVLQAAVRLARSNVSVRHHVRFAFWSAEELGLLGSKHHVAQLSDVEREAMRLYINLDMVGSRNFGRFIYSSPQSSQGLYPVALAALREHFRQRDLPFEERMVGGRQRTASDDASFAARGIPTLGLYTGAGERKNDAQGALFGGAVGQPFDACYHQACDTTDNVEGTVLNDMSEALFAALIASAAPDMGAKQPNVP
ncbi:M20/M25/M40 family metallo-hydrolase [Salinarimonas soli]|uniref:M20/M25/M40 family metallo-hydrolase n=1 Tax=Salinarimonas soli TaxID=1638099 RepID=UPI001661E722|nr:M20/M25/M40 family metallo-hydrolase [Salinarimonas soli]